MSRLKNGQMSTMDSATDRDRDMKEKEQIGVELFWDALPLAVSEDEITSLKQVARGVI